MGQKKVYLNLIHSQDRLLCIKYVPISVVFFLIVRNQFTQSSLWSIQTNSNVQRKKTETKTTILYIREIFPMKIREYTTSIMCYKTFPKLDLYFKRTFLQDLIKMIETNMLILRCYIYQYLFKILPLNVNVQHLCILCNAIFFISCRNLKKSI